MGGRAWYTVRWLEKCVRSIEGANQHDGHPQYHEPSSSKVAKKCHCSIAEELNVTIGGHSVVLLTTVDTWGEASHFSFVVYSFHWQAAVRDVFGSLIHSASVSRRGVEVEQVRR